MPGAKVIPCALCQIEAAAIYCVNDDAHLCASCDAATHSANPLLARHERRPLSALTCQAAECASAAHGGAAPSAATDVDVAVVPQLATSPESGAAPLPKVDPEPAAPLTLYEDSFFARSLTTSDLLDLDSDELELPGSSAPFSFDPLVDCVVPSFEDELRPAAPVAESFPQQVRRMLARCAGCCAAAAPAFPFPSSSCLTWPRTRCHLCRTLGCPSSPATCPATCVSSRPSWFLWVVLPTRPSSLLP
jgi:hypothetical protein